MSNGEQSKLTDGNFDAPANLFSGMCFFFSSRLCNLSQLLFRPILHSPLHPGFCFYFLCRTAIFDLGEPDYADARPTA